MLAQINGVSLYKPILNTVIKSLLPYILTNQEWNQYLTMLAKIKNTFLVIDNKLINYQDPKYPGRGKCPICQNFLHQNNWFVLILHMEIEHQAQDKRYYNIEQESITYKVKQYEFTYDGLQIHLVNSNNFLSEQIPKKSGKGRKTQKIDNNSSQNQIKFKDFYVRKSKDTGYLTGTLKQRNLALLERMFGKMSKRIQKISSQRKHYHSYNVFRQISPESQDQDSEQQIQNLVQKQMQKLRINDFNDVSHWDKVIFIEWNNLIRQQKKAVKMIYQNQKIVDILRKFSVICKQKGIPRINYNMHLYCMWSTGLIQNFQIFELLAIYEKYGTEDDM